VRSYGKCKPLDLPNFEPDLNVREDRAVQLPKRWRLRFWTEAGIQIDDMKTRMHQFSGILKQVRISCEEQIDSTLYEKLDLQRDSVEHVIRTWLSEPNY
jgi:hypothetical protein